MKTIKATNLFYVSNFNDIGGVETYIFELARKYYKKFDITVVYNTGSEEQLKRLRQYVKVIKYNGEQIECVKAFFNYETDIINNIKADEYIQLIHAMFKTQNLIPFINPKITKFYCVSKAAGKEWKELTGIKCILNRNPLEITPEEKKPVLYLVSATRLTAEKGKDRMIKLGQLLDNAKIPYIWLVFTNDTEAIDNPNIIYCKPRLNIRPVLASLKGIGYGVQLSDCEGDCYFTRECEALGVPLLVTPVESFKEQGLKDGVNCYYIPFDVENVDVERIYNKIPKYKPFKREDDWKNNLVKSKSKYKYDPNKLVEVQAINYYDDIELKRSIEYGDTFKTRLERAYYLERNGLVEIKE